MLACLLMLIVAPDSAPLAPHVDERNFVALRQLTFGGQNAEAYWNIEGTRIVYQATLPQYPDEQIFVMNADGSGKTLVSTGKGRTTCGYFSPDGRWIYFSSTHERSEGKQAAVDMSAGYVWMVNPQLGLYRVPSNRPGSTPKPVIVRDAYVAEATIDPRGQYITFTGSFDGDLEIYRSNLNGGDIRRLTHEEGYDGGPFVSWDGRKIVYRRDAIKSDEERKDYLALLARHLVRPSKLEIWIMDADGSNKRQVTRLGSASFAPFLHPDGKRIIFCTNYATGGREFDLWMIRVDGTGLRRITYTPEFDGFPMFSRDGERLLFASNRNGKVRGETNVFVAEWRD